MRRLGRSLPAPSRQGLEFTTVRTVVHLPQTHCSSDVHQLSHKKELVHPHSSSHSAPFWLVVWNLEHVLFFHALGIIIPTDFHIFQRG
jgi:hypothetical protein